VCEFVYVCIRTCVYASLGWLSRVCIKCHVFHDSLIRVTHVKRRWTPPAVSCMYVVVCCSVLQCVAVCCSVLQCVAVYCSVLQSL